MSFKPTINRNLELQSSEGFGNCCSMWMEVQREGINMPRFRNAHGNLLQQFLGDKV